MTRGALILILTVLAVCNLSYTTTNYPFPGNVIIEGKGIDSFEIHSTTADVVEKKLGTTYELVNHSQYSFEMVYKETGISFYYYTADSTKEIFAIAFRKPFSGKTTKGISLGVQTMEEVVKIYGEPDWSSCEGCDRWDVGYEGIQFSVERDKSLPQYPLDEARHLKRKIVEITVINKDE